MRRPFAPRAAAVPLLVVGLVAVLMAGPVQAAAPDVREVTPAGHHDRWLSDGVDHAGRRVPRRHV